MPVIRVDALCACDFCAKQFGVEIELSEQIEKCEDFEALVRDMIMGGNTAQFQWGVRGKKTIDRFPLSYAVTIQGGYMLCDECSQKCDDAEDENAASVPLTGEQVREILEAP